MSTIYDEGIDEEAKLVEVSGGSGRILCPYCQKAIRIASPLEVELTEAITRVIVSRYPARGISGALPTVAKLIASGGYAKDEFLEFMDSQEE